MILNVVVLLATLAIGLIGSVTSLTQSLIGKITVAALLAISTGVSIWLKRVDQIKSDEVHRGVRDMSLRTIPPDESFDYVSQVLDGFLRHRKGLRLASTTTKIERASDAYIVHILFSNPNPASGLDPDEFEWKDHPELIYGVIVLDDEDIRKLSRLKIESLERALQGGVVDAWGSDRLDIDADHITSRISILADGILSYRDTPSPFKYSISRTYSTASSSAAIEISTKGMDGDANSNLVIDAAFIAFIMREPALVRGKHILHRIDDWLLRVAASTEARPPELPDTPTMPIQIPNAQQLNPGAGLPEPYPPPAGFGGQAPNPTYLPDMTTWQQPPVDRTKRSE